MTGSGAAALAVAALAVPAFAGTARRPQPVLTAGPGRVLITGAGRSVVRVAAPAGPTRVTAALVPYSLDLRGRPRLLRGAAVPGWLRVSPAALLAGRRMRDVVVRAQPARSARAGDHVAVLLLAAAPREAGGIDIRARLGIVVTARVPGRLVHRLEVRSLSLRRRGRRRTLELSLQNAGNVTETLSAGRVSVELWQRGRLLVRFHPRGRELLPRSRGVVLLGCPAGARGAAVARVRIGATAHRYPLRL